MRLQSARQKEIVAVSGCDDSNVFDNDTWGRKGHVDMRDGEGKDPDSSEGFPLISQSCSEAVMDTMGAIDGLSHRLETAATTCSARSPPTALSPPSSLYRSHLSFREVLSEVQDLPHTDVPKGLQRVRPVVCVPPILPHRESSLEA